MFYLIYKITNKINNKIYVGSHKTTNKDDGYMGSGKYLNRAIKKYGVENFTKEILFVFDNPTEMYNKEAEIVNDDFLAEETTYNLKRGGFGGFDYINKAGINNSAGQYVTAKNTMLNKLATDKEFKKKFSETQSARVRQEYINGKRISPLANKKLRDEMAARAASPESAKKRIDTFLRINHQQGPLNSQYGSMWITDGFINSKINKCDIIPDGWKKGRTIKNNRV